MVIDSDSSLLLLSILKFDPIEIGVILKKS